MNRKLTKNYKGNQKIEDKITKALVLFKVHGRRSEQGNGRQCAKPGAAYLLGCKNAYNEGDDKVGQDDVPATTHRYGHFLPGIIEYVKATGEKDNTTNNAADEIQGMRKLGGQ